MRFQHSNACPERVVEPVATRFNPEQNPKDREIEKENDVRHLATGKRDRDDGGAAGDGPVGRYIESLPPNHDSTHFAAVEMRHRIDVSGVVNAVLDRNGGLFGCGRRAIFGCHDYSLNRISGSESNIIMAIA